MLHDHGRVRRYPGGGPTAISLLLAALSGAYAGCAGVPPCPEGTHASDGHCCGAGEEWVPASGSCVCLEAGGCSPRVAITASAEPVAASHPGIFGALEMGLEYGVAQTRWWDAPAEWDDLPVAGEYAGVEVRYRWEGLTGLPLEALPFSPYLRACAGDPSSYAVQLYVHRRLFRVSVRLSPTCSAAPALADAIARQMGAAVTASGSREVVYGTATLALVPLAVDGSYTLIEAVATEGPRADGQRYAVAARADLRGSGPPEVCERHFARDPGAVGWLRNPFTSFTPTCASAGYRSCLVFDERTMRASEFAAHCPGAAMYTVARADGSCCDEYAFAAANTSGTSGYYCCR